VLAYSYLEIPWNKWTGVAFASFFGTVRLYASRTGVVDPRGRFKVGMITLFLFGVVG